MNIEAEVLGINVEHLIDGYYSKLFEDFSVWCFIRYWLKQIVLANNNRARLKR